MTPPARPTVAVLFGGRSNEHDVSLHSAAAVLGHLDPARYAAVPIGITRSGDWCRYRGPVDAVADGTWERRAADLTPVAVSPSPSVRGLIELGGVRILMLHGHTRGVKSDVMRAVWAARECGAQVLLFGHTHRPLVDNDGALLVLNPGAAGDLLHPTCGILTIENGRADVRTLAL